MLKNRAVGRSSALHGLRFFEVLTNYSPQPGPVYFSTRMNSPVEALTATVSLAVSRVAP